MSYLFCFCVSHTVEAQRAQKMLNNTGTFETFHFDKKNYYAWLPVFLLFAPAILFARPH